jgi:hypothetical protein
VLASQRLLLALGHHNLRFLEEADALARYAPHPVFEVPDDNTVIWRYMGFSKFISLLNSSALYFTVATKFEDRWEGTIPIANKTSLDPITISFHEQSRARTAVNCWHERERESATMWKSYTSGNEGIAVRSTVGRLKACFRETEGTITSDASVFVGQVKYLDYDREVLDVSNGFIPLLRKRSFFSDEKEVRAVISTHLLSEFFLQGMHGVHVPIDLDALIEEVFIDPVANDWFVDLVRSIVGERFSIVKSSIGERPPMTTDDPPVMSYMMTKKAGQNWERK